MKKKTLKIGLIMTCFAMICTSIVGYTMAQFMTQDTKNNSATMAKWGVTVSASGTMFANSYNTTAAPTPTDKDGTTISVSVQNGTAGDLIAPGTSNGTGLTFGVTGAPQVAVNVTFAVTASDVYLKDNSAVDTVLGGDGLAGDYYPIEFVLKKGEDVAATGTLAAIKTHLETYNHNYTANTNLADNIGEFTLTWSYAFEGHSAEDTLLGNLAAGPVGTLAAGTDYNLNATFNLTITVTQID